MSGVARSIDKLKTFHPRQRKAWRAWLAKHHDGSPGVWLIYYKKATGKPRVAYEEAVEEALCFGWIDSLPRKLDEERSMLLFTPRKRGSVWSRPNKLRVERLLAEGLMTEAGLKKVEAAKADGSWAKLDAVDALRLPADLKKALASDEGARKNFESFSPSARKGLLWWVESAKRPETRRKRIEETVEKARRNIRPNDHHTKNQT